MKLSLLVVLFALLSVSLVLGAPRPSAQRLRQRPQAVPASVVRPATNATAAFGTCWIGNINDCTGESRAWTEATPAARATPYIQSASLGTATIGVPGLSPNVGFALNEVGACAGTCMAPNSASCASKKWQRGVCPGTTICCLKATAAPAAAAPAAAAPAAAAPAAAAAAPAGLTGSSPRVKDPTALVAGGRSIQWSDLTTEQQTNARLLVRYAKQQSITNINQVAYILGTATWECHLKPIKEFGGPKKRYAPYYGRGFVQLTWRENYRTMTNLLKSQAGITADLVRTPDLALNPTNAAFIAAYGMKYGSFTTRKLDDYFTATASNWVGARAIINGSDKADIIAKLGRAWVPLVRLLMA